MPEHYKALVHVSTELLFPEAIDKCAWYARRLAGALKNTAEDRHISCHTDISVGSEHMKRALPTDLLAWITVQPEQCSETIRKIGEAIVQNHARFTAIIAPQMPSTEWREVLLNPLRRFGHPIEVHLIDPFVDEIHQHANALFAKLLEHAHQPTPPPLPPTAIWRGV
ncbi:MAG: hypothetical protein WCX61_01030 [Candidatus Peribacteraceae bacterium]|jgi:hypothetical protein